MYTASLDSTVTALTCTAGQAAIFDGTDWGCKADAVGRSIKAVRNTALETAGSVGYWPSVVVGDDGNPVIAYAELTTAAFEMYVCSVPDCLTGTAVTATLN